MKKLLIRSLSALVFSALTIAALLINEYVFAAYILFIMTGMMMEFFRMTMGERFRSARLLTIVTAFALFVLIFSTREYGLPTRFVSLAGLPVMLMMSSSFFYKDKTSFQDYSFLFTSLLYIALPLSLSSTVVLHNANFNGMVILAFFLIIWSSDVGAYLVGMSLGQMKGSTKLCPDISPRKSWAGFWGGLFAAALVGYLVTVFGLLDVSWIHGIIIGIVMGVAGVCGDLFESMWKRHYGFKDSGNLIPGHGGLLDRFDSSLFAMPVGAIYMALFNLL